MIIFETNLKVPVLGTIVFVQIVRVKTIEILFGSSGGKLPKKESIISNGSSVKLFELVSYFFLFSVFSL
jgi:hypothetical protein